MGQGGARGGAFESAAAADNLRRPLYDFIGASSRPALLSPGGPSGETGSRTISRGEVDFLRGSDGERPGIR